MIYEWFLRRFSTRHADLFKAWVLATSIPPPVRLRAQELVHIFDTKPQTGEWKRHQVYARLLKEYPTIPKHHIGLLIEVVKCSL